MHILYELNRNLVKYTCGCALCLDSRLSFVAPCVPHRRTAVAVYKLYITV